VARVGGDEFTLLLPGVSQEEDAIEVAERILARLKQPRVLAGHEFRVSTSIGITVYPKDGEDSEALLRNADTAMYRAKEQGRDNYQCYVPTMNNTILERLALERDLRLALERDEFRIHYQPLADVVTGRVTGMEALARWQHPERGLVPPDAFISVAEETGVILQLGEWVLRTACRQNKEWQDAGYPPVRVTVNLSARQLQDEFLVGLVSGVLEETGLDPRYLQLEITEGAVMTNLEFIIEMLHELRAMGVGISVDDFGTGYSSLSYLKRFPIDGVKIDRSFVRDLATDPNDAAIVTTIIAMAHNLGVKVIAEGVETEEQLDFLRARGCNEFQGYLLSRPVTVKAFEKLLRNGAPRPPRTVHAKPA
jgi:predicted signal transduction protein with EAL and GGDEF domain